MRVVKGCKRRLGVKDCVFGSFLGEEICGRGVRVVWGVEVGVEGCFKKEWVVLGILCFYLMRFSFYSLEDKRGSRLFRFKNCS